MPSFPLLVGKKAGSSRLGQAGLRNFSRPWVFSSKFSLWEFSFHGLSEEAHGEGNTLSSPCRGKGRFFHTSQCSKQTHLGDGHSVHGEGVFVLCPLGTAMNKVLREVLGRIEEQ